MALSAAPSVLKVFRHLKTFWGMNIIGNRLIEEYSIKLYFFKMQTPSEVQQLPDLARGESEPSAIQQSEEELSSIFNDQKNVKSAVIDEKSQELPRAMQKRESSGQ